MTLLLLHGAGGSRAQLDALAALVARRRPVHQLEFEGHGTTPSRGRPASVAAFVENAIAALDSRGLEKVDVFGYELGRIHHRVRIMVGDRDGAVSVEESAAAFRSLPSGELMVLPRTPHPIEQVDAYRLTDVLIELTS